MKTILTMQLDDTFVTFKIFANGSATETKTGEVFPDFASAFEMLSNLGWHIVAETDIAVEEGKGKAELIPFPNDRGTFREQWNEYMTEYSDNLEVAWV